MKCLIVLAHPEPRSYNAQLANATKEVLRAQGHDVRLSDLYAQSFESAMLSVTAGSSREACSPDGQEGDTRLILWPVHYSLHYVGFTVLEPVIVTDVRGGRSAAEAELRGMRLEQQLLDHGSMIERIDERSAIAFNRADDWDERGKLKPGAPVYSPFIRHAMS